MEKNWKNKKEYQFGDIVVAKRKWENLEIGHTHSPHIVIANDGEYIYAITGSTKKPYFHWSRKCIHTKIRNVDAYYEPKIFKFKYEEIMYKTGSVSSITKSYIKRKLDSQVIYDLNIENELFLSYVETAELETGDIIKCDADSYKGKRFAIISQNEEAYQTVEITKNKEVVNDNSQLYNFRPDVIYQIDKTEKITRIDCLDLKETEELLLKVKTSAKRNEKDAILQGNIISIDDKNYYVFEIVNSNAYIFPISTNINYDDSFSCNDSKYHINFSCKLSLDIKLFNGKVISLVPYKTLLSLERKYTEYKKNKSIKNKYNEKTRIFKDAKINQHQYLILNQNKTEIIIFDITDYYNGIITIKKEHIRFLIKNPIGYLSVPDYNNILCDINEIIKKEYNISLPKYSNTRVREKNNKTNK